MTTVVVTAVGLGLGIIGLIVALNPATPTLRAALARLDGPPSRTAGMAGFAGFAGQPDAARPGSQDRIDRYLAGRLAAAATERDDLRAWLMPLLALTGVSIQELCGEVLLGASVGLVLPGLWWLVVTAGGVHIPLTIPVWVGLALAGLGGLVPIGLLRGKANQARRAARRVVGSFLNLVVLSLAGGMGIEGALHASAQMGEDKVSGQILTSLVLAQDAGQPPWDALEHLGVELGIPELEELAAAVGLAGAEGARIRLTLAAKAKSIRQHDLAEAESEANAVTERLFLPGVFLLVGFLLFIAYPAVARISAGL
jgi:tight adherence protein C